MYEYLLQQYAFDKFYSDPHGCYVIQVIFYIFKKIYLLKHL